MNETTLMEALPYIAGLVTIVTAGHIAVIVSLSRKLFRTRSTLKLTEKQLHGYQETERRRREHLKRIASDGARAATKAKVAKRKGVVA